MAKGIYIRSKALLEQLKANAHKYGFQKGFHPPTEFKKGIHPPTEFKKGLTPWNKGKKTGPLSVEMKKRLSKSGMGKNKGRKRPDLSARNKIDIRWGEMNGNWKGGTTPLVIAIRNSFKYRQWRSDVYLRDYWTCQDCFLKKGIKIEAHHKDAFADIMKRNKIQTLQEAFDCEELWNIENGITLCDKCHGKIKVKYNNI